MRSQHSLKLIRDCQCKLTAAHISTNSTLNQSCQCTAGRNHNQGQLGTRQCTAGRNHNQRQPTGPATVNVLQLYKHCRTHHNSSCYCQCTGTPITAEHVTTMHHASKYNHATYKSLHGYATRRVRCSSCQLSRPTVWPLYSLSCEPLNHKMRAHAC